jgi:hypothetical protein
MRNRIIVLAVVMMLAATMVWAGDGKSGTYSPAEHAAKLQKKLGLSEQQTQQVQALFEQTHEKISALKASGPDEATLKAEKMKIKAEKHDKLKSILTTEQWAQYEKMMAEHHKAEQPKSNP